MKKMFISIIRFFGFKKSKKQNQRIATKNQIEETQKALNEIKVVHQDVTNHIEKNFSKNKKELVVDPRLTTSQLVKYFNENGFFSVENMSRKEKQFYAKKIYTLRVKKSMPIFYEHKNKTYKLLQND